MLRTREGDVEHGIPITPKMGRITFEDAADDFLNDYQINCKRTHADAKGRITLPLQPAFKGKRLLSITTSDIRAYIATRQAPLTREDGTAASGAANATINRELAALKRMFTLAVQAGKLHAKPHIPMLQENNTRRGFFEREQFEAVRAHLPAEIRPVVTFAYLTGWRLRSEILPLEWRQVDWTGRVVRLDPGTTKNKVRSKLPLHGRTRNLERAGVPRTAAMAMVGHKTEAIYRRYAIVDAGALRDAATKIDSAAGTLSGTIGRDQASAGTKQTA